jgi:hypothetical protein
VKQLSSTLVIKRQGVQIQVVYDIEGHKIRATVYVDSYDFQSFAKAERWNGERWYEIATIEYGAMHSAKVANKHKPDAHNETALNVDVERLIGHVKDVLF